MTVETPGSSVQIEKYFESGYALYRATSSKDASGGFVNDWKKVKGLVGRLRTNMNGSLGFPMRNDKQTEECKYRFYCGVDDIRVGDEIRTDVLRFEVQMVNDVMTFGRFLQLELELIDERVESSE